MRRITLPSGSTSAWAFEESKATKFSTSWNACRSPDPFQFVEVWRYPTRRGCPDRIRNLQLLALPIRLEALQRPFRVIQSHLPQPRELFGRIRHIEMPRDATPRGLRQL